MLWILLSLFCFYLSSYTFFQSENIPLFLCIEQACSSTIWKKLKCKLSCLQEECSYFGMYSVYQQYICLLLVARDVFIWPSFKYLIWLQVAQLDPNNKSTELMHSSQTSMSLINISLNDVSLPHFPTVHMMKKQLSNFQT